MKFLTALVEIVNNKIDVKHENGVALDGEEDVTGEASMLLLLSPPLCCPSFPGICC